MKFILIQLSIILFSNIGFGQISQEDFDKLETNVESLNNKIDLIADSESVLGLGITMGIGYFTGSLDQPLVGKAKIDETGIVRVEEERTRITRIFPTLTGFIRPFYSSNKMKSVKNLFIGGTVGVNDGVSNVGSGFSMAIGFSTGFIIKDKAHFGIFYGYVYDPSVTILPDGFIEGMKAPNGYPINSIIQTKSINAKYGSIGMIFSLTL